MDENRNKPQKIHHGVIVPVITPLTEKGELDESALRKHVEFLIDGGIHGLFVLGTAGEGPSVPRSMRARVVHLAVEHARGRARVYAGVLDNSAMDVVTSAREFLRLGTAGIVVQLPNYYQLSPDEQFRYFANLAERIPGPILLYEIPATVHMTLDMSVIEHLRAFSNVVGIKDSSGDRDRMQVLLDAYRDDPVFSVLVGASSLNSFGLQHGADGIVPSIGNLEPALCARLYASSLKGDWTLMNELQNEMDTLIRECSIPGFIGQSIALMKYQMSLRGLCGPGVFSPLQVYNRQA